MRLFCLRARLIALAIFLLSFISVHARVVRVEILSHEDLQDGTPFASAGPYERILGRVYFAMNPDNPHNRQIVDLDKAPRNQNGEVEFSADLYLLKPKDMTKGNGAVLFEVSNRGGRGILRIVNGGDARNELGDGFLMRRGYTIAWLGWQYDLADRNHNLRLTAPMADDDGELHGLVRADFTLAEKRDDMPLGHIMLGPDGGQSYAVDNPANPLNVLTVRNTREGGRRTIPRAQWTFAHMVDGKLTPDPRYIHLYGGFQPGRIYEVVYMAKNAAVVGVGLAAVRDFLSYLKHDSQAVAPVQRVYAVGISQSGRFLRHFLYQDFNADEQSQQVMDGVIAHVAGAGRGSFNHRFAQPSRDSQPMSSIVFPTDLFPFTDVPQTDPRTRDKAGLLDAASRSHTAPKLFLTNTSYEYWGRAASLIHTSPDGTKDITPGINTRVYLLVGLQHFTDPFPPQKTTPNNLDYTSQQRHNANPIQWFWRALITDMDQWVVTNTDPPANTVPHVADGTLVPLKRWIFPRIPGVDLPHEMNTAHQLDFGRSWAQGVVTKEPPKVGPAYAAMVPQPDADGNDQGGVRLPSLQVPLATYTGWNLRDPSIGAPDQRTSFLGSTIPFARTADERKKSGDPRLSIAERYSSRVQYLWLYRDAAMRLVQERFLLQEDVPAVMQRGEREWEEFAGH
jgi:hypothetical protein